MEKKASHIMKILILTGVLVGIISLPVTGMAQNDTEPNPFQNDTTTIQKPISGSKSDHSLDKWALLFQIDNNFTLKDFSGTLISLQKNLSSQKAVRWGLSLDGGYNEQKNNPNQKKTTGNADIHISMNYLWYHKAYRHIRFYYGIGPVVGFGYDHSKNSQNSGVNITKQINTSEQIGLNGVAGVEWFVKPQISLLAEYVPEMTGNFSSNFTKTSNSTTGASSRNKTSARGIQFHSIPVRFGVSVYFR